VICPTEQRGENVDRSLARVPNSIAVLLLEQPESLATRKGQRMNLTKTSTLTVTTNSKGGTGTFTLTIKGSSSGVSHTTTVGLTVSH